MKRIILSLSLIVGDAGAVTIGATGAFFSDLEESVGNTFAAGDIDLLVDNESYYNGVLNEGTTWDPVDLTIEKFFDFDDVKPGDYGEDTISLHVDTNDAYLCADVTLTSDDDNTQTEPEALVDPDGLLSGELADLVEFIWWADDGDNVFEDDEDIISQGPIGALPLGEPLTLALADSDENIWDDDGEGPIEGDKTYYIAKAWCFGTIESLPLEQDGEVDDWSPADDNDGNQTAGEPEDGGFMCDGSLVGNESQTDSLTADVSFIAMQARHNLDFQCEVDLPECEPEQAYADNVVDFDQGTRKNGTAINADRTDSNDVLGAPQSLGAPFDNPVPTGEFFSLGFKANPPGTATSAPGGWIVVEFTDNVIVDGPGNDLRVWEVTGGSNYPVEKVKIEVSQNGTDWSEVASSLDRDAEADLADSGLPWAAYVRLTDVSDPNEFNATADGFDVDAFSALNCAANLII